MIDLINFIWCYLFTGYAWAEDKEHCEEYGRMLQADSSKVSPRAKKRGLPQVIFLYMLYIFIQNNIQRSKYMIVNWKVLKQLAVCVEDE